MLSLSFLFSQIGRIGNLVNLSLRERVLKHMRNYILLLCSIAILHSCTKVWHTAESNYAAHQMDSTAVTSALIKDMIAPYKEKLDGEMNSVIATCPEDMPKDRPESTLGNWMSDVIYDKANELSEVPIDFAMQNSGGIRIPLLRKGDITKGKIFELMPFDNALVVVHVDQELLLTFLDRVARSGGWPVSKNFQMKIANSKVDEVTIGGEMLTDRVYNIALPDYIANGGSDCKFFIGCERTTYPVLLRDMFVDKATADKVIASKIEGRILR